MLFSHFSASRYYYSVLFGVLVLLFVCLAIFDIFFGSVKIPFKDTLAILFTNHSDKPEWVIIINEFRIPKTFTAILAGAALSVSGLQMQTIFRNPLAGPDVLGISSGASLGVAIVLMGFSSIFTLDISGMLGNWVIIISSWLGSALVLLIIFYV